MKVIWYCCPYCNQKLFQLAEGASGHGILIKCKKCKKIINATYSNKE